jgi:hypothetical protein
METKYLILALVVLALMSSDVLKGWIDTFSVGGSAS